MITTCTAYAHGDARSRTCGPRADVTAHGRTRMKKYKRCHLTIVLLACQRFDLALGDEQVPAHLLHLLRLLAGDMRQQGMVGVRRRWSRRSKSFTQRPDSAPWFRQCPKLTWSCSLPRSFPTFSRSAWRENGITVVKALTNHGPAVRNARYCFFFKFKRQTPPSLPP